MTGLATRHMTLFLGDGAKGLFQQMNKTPEICEDSICLSWNLGGFRKWRNNITLHSDLADTLEAQVSVARYDPGKLFIFSIQYCDVYAFRELIEST